MSDSIFFNLNPESVKWKKKTIDSAKAWELFKNFSQFEGGLVFPTIEPLLDEFERLDKVYLIVLGAESEESSFNHGLLIKRWIEENYSDNLQVIIWELDGLERNVKSVYDFYAERLIHVNPQGRKIFSLSGSTPIMDAALFIHASTIFYDVRLYQLDSKSDRLTRLPHRETVRKLLTKQSAETLIKQKEYGAAIKLLESELIPGRENLVILLNYGRHRLYFNFDEARRALSKLEEGLNFQEENEISKMFSMKVDDLRGKLIELGWSTLIKLDREEYVDFVGRLFRFQEALAEYVFQTKTGAEVDWESRSAGNQAFREDVRKDEELVKKIRQELKDDPGESLEGLKINTTVLHVCFRHFVERDGRRWGPLWNIYKKTRRIVDNLRHYTIIAHGFQGISREKIEKELESDTLEEFRLEIERAVELVAGQQVENPFNRINSISRKGLQKL